MQTMNCMMCMLNDSYLLKGNMYLLAEISSLGSYLPLRVLVCLTGLLDL